MLKGFFYIKDIFGEIQDGPTEMGASAIRGGPRCD
jgi:hypothetical protein